MTEDHPRSRGVYYGRITDVTPFTGSSPLARGLRLDLEGDAGQRRIIPARAGFTPPPAGKGRPPGDHPRSRGVYLLRRRTRRSALGSSPLARGLQWIRNPGGPARRIIPARAGFTGRPLTAPGENQDHPRSRGVYIAGTPGMSPEQWIIPARAGFTYSASESAPTVRDHPRSRGVYPWSSPWT